MVTRGPGIRRDALAAYASERLIAYATSSRVDAPQNNDETLLEPLQTDVD